MIKILILVLIAILGITRPSFKKELVSEDGEDYDILFNFHLPNGHVVCLKIHSRLNNP